MADLLDVAIVGAGAAGIAAGRRLAAAGRSVRLIEALPRLGGRALTRRAGGLPLDLGCGWLHSGDRNPLAALAAAEGVALDRRAAAWGSEIAGVGATQATQEAAWGAWRAFGRRLRQDPPPSDRAGDALAPDAPWRGFVDALSGFMNGVATDRLSVRDFLAYDDAATEANWRLPGGYGAFLAGLGAALPVALGTRVAAVSEAGRHLRLETDRGAFAARAAIVTVSTAVLATGAIRFGPAADGHLEAAARLPLGRDDKVFLSLADPAAAPPESHLLGRFDTARTGSYYLRPFGRPVVECFLGGPLAAELEAAGEAAAVAFVTAELAALLGARFARGLAPLAVSAWGCEPTILGAYSHALPGAAGARAVLAAPVSERLAFAGEACSAHDFSTAHGAWASGIAAADRIEAALARPSRSGLRGRGGG